MWVAWELLAGPQPLLEGPSRARAVLCQPSFWLQLGGGKRVHTHAHTYSRAAASYTAACQSQDPLIRLVHPPPAAESEAWEVRRPLSNLLGVTHSQ